MGTGGEVPGTRAESKWVGEVSVADSRDWGPGDLHVGSLGLDGGEGVGICFGGCACGHYCLVCFWVGGYGVVVS